MLQPLLQMNTLPYSFEDRGTFPLGYLARNASSERTVALPLIDASGLMSQDGDMYSSFYDKH